MHGRQGQADGDTSESRRRDLLGDEQDDEHEGAGQQYFEQECAGHRDGSVVVRVRTQTTGVVGGAERRHEELEHAGRDDGADDLCDPVPDGVTPRHATSDSHAESDRGVHVRSGNRPVGVGDPE